ncbi:uncharacterized protein DNG_00097 [Cephalotrichum gorgonifer]|uniref:Uncharacterized protein n=1 Tax=Cephalotrichum gorgonifer TaxID=2041049 RepID=A0AAE8MQ04_9PEZI|nr:uncharacterized protein DNG_00097 [Cephalotrichum gorgonifer]
MASNQPQLRSGVDLQLQTAFSEGNWPTVVRLADKRARTLKKDPYYEILKISAEAQLGSPAEKAAVVAYVQNLVKAGTPVADVESLELLEWASNDVVDEGFYREAIGPLRVRLAKANPKDKMTAIDCLESCLLHWDLSSAQQIAALTDRSFPQEHGFLFWNIVTTYLYSSSDQCPSDKQKLYKMLSIKQIEKAAQLTEKAMEAGEEDMPLRGIHTEEEILLYFDMLESGGDLAQLKGVLAGPLLNPLNQFRLGRKEIVLRAVRVLAKAKEWQAVYSLTRDCLSEKDEQGRPSLLASDWNIWKSLVEAATHLMSTNPNLIREVSELIDSHLSVEGLKPIYARTLMLAKVLVSFELGEIGQPGTTLKPAQSARVLQLIQFVEAQHDSPSCFQDIKRFVERLGTAEQEYFAYDRLPAIAEESSGYKAIAFQVLTWKVRYLILTTPQGRSLTGLAAGDSTKRGEEKIAVDSLRLYRTLEAAEPNEMLRAQQDFMPDLAILASICLLKIGGVGRDPTSAGFESHRTDFRDLLLAAIVLEHQLQKTPKHSGINLLLSRLYLNLGCAKRAYAHWDTIEVKRTIVESHGPLFFDRLSGAAPDVASGPLLSSSVQSHYLRSLKLRMPRNLGDAFDAEAYTSILQIPKHTDSLRTSCTMVLGFMEEMRAQRAMRTKTGDSLAVPLIAEITDETELSSRVDYASFPNLESGLQPPLYEALAPGPRISNARSHLTILAERYFSLLHFKPPTPYKPASATQAAAADHAHVVETLSRLGNSLNKFLRGGSATDVAELTAHERVYYNLLSLLTSLVLEAVGSTRQGPASETLPALVDSAVESLEVLLDLTAGQISAGEGKGGEEPRDSILVLASLIPISYVRDAASAVAAAAAYVTGHHERQTARDRSGETALRKEVLVGMKTLEGAARDAQAEGAGWISGVKDEVSKACFVQILAGYVNGEDAGDGQESRSELEAALGRVIKADGAGEVNIWARRVVDGWRANVEGWARVKWD